MSNPIFREFHPFTPGTFSFPVSPEEGKNKNTKHSQNGLGLHGNKLGTLQPDKGVKDKGWKKVYHCGNSGEIHSPETQTHYNRDSIEEL